MLCLSCRHQLLLLICCCLRHSPVLKLARLCSPQAVPLYLSEMAPARRRGAVTITFHLGAAFGLLSAQITNYFTAQISDQDNAFGCGRLRQDTVHC